MILEIWDNLLTTCLIGERRSGSLVVDRQCQSSSSQALGEVQTLLLVCILVTNSFCVAVQD